MTRELGAGPVRPRAVVELQARTSLDVFAFIAAEAGQTTAFFNFTAPQQASFPTSFTFFYLSRWMQC